MDILISSNLERLLYILTGCDDAKIREWFGALAETGRYEVTDAVKAVLKEEFFGGFCDDEETKATIRCIPVDSAVCEEEGKCIYTGKPSHQRVLFAISY